jgi:hypothetical protein
MYASLHDYSCWGEKGKPNINGERLGGIIAGTRLGQEEV